jgi:hypothetical protein
MSDFRLLSLLVLPRSLISLFQDRQARHFGGVPAVASMLEHYIHKKYEYEGVGASVIISVISISHFDASYFISF